MNRMQLSKEIAALAERTNFKSMLVPLLTIFVILHIPSLSTFSLSIDDEQAALRVDVGPWIQQGRWATAAIEQFLFPQPSLTFMPELAFGFLLVVSYLLIIDACGLSISRGHSYLFFALFVSFPTWFFIREFYANIPAAGLGMLLTALSCWCFSALTSRRLTQASVALVSTLGTLSLATAIGFYQSYVMLGGAAYASVMLMQRLDRKISPRETARAILIALMILIASMGVYYIILLITLHFSRLDLSYVGSFFDIYFPISDPFGAGYVFSRELVKTYVGSERMYGVNNYSFALLALLGPVSAIVAKTTNFEKVIRATLIVCIFSAPFALQIFSSATLPYRTLVAIPSIFIFSVLMLWKRPSMRPVATLITFAVIAQSIQSTSLFHTSNVLVGAHDREVAAILYQRLAEAHPQFDRERQVTLLLMGSLPFESPYPKIPTTVIGSSFFEWDGGETRRAVGFMSVLGYPNLVAATPEEAARHTSHFEQMPIWPTPGAVQFLDGIVVARMGPKLGPLHALGNASPTASKK